MRAEFARLLPKHQPENVSKIATFAVPPVVGAAGRGAAFAVEATVEIAIDAAITAPTLRNRRDRVV
jgi:hypothetical protein